MNNIEEKIKKIGRKQKAYKRLMKKKRIQNKVINSVAKRRAKEKRLKIYGISAILISFIFLFFMFFNIISTGYSAFYQTQISLKINFDKDIVASENYRKLIRISLQDIFQDVKGRRHTKKLTAFVSSGASYKIADIIRDNPDYIGSHRQIWVPASTKIDMILKEKTSNKLSDEENEWLSYLQQNDLIKKSFNTDFFTHGDSREPELAGILGSFVGSLLIVVICILFAFPLGVMTAIYLEEFAPKNKFTDFIEVNINNLAAVPSIVFGLLGLAIFIQFFGIPRSAPLAGGLTLSLMALPIIVIATRTSIRAIPGSIKDGAMALGASKVQTTLHHVLPLAVPGIMTGTILSVARILGETAPLLMIGMVAFIVDVPSNFIDAATALPVQIYLWADSPETGFAEKTSAAIIVLLLFLAFINAFAVYLRKKFEIRW